MVQRVEDALVAVFPHQLTTRQIAVKLHMNVDVATVLINDILYNYLLLKGFVFKTLDAPPRWSATHTGVQQSLQRAAQRTCTDVPPVPVPAARDILVLLDLGAPETSGVHAEHVLQQLEPYADSTRLRQHSTTRLNNVRAYAPPDYIGYGAQGYPMAHSIRMWRCGDAGSTSQTPLQRVEEDLLDILSDDTLTWPATILVVATDTWGHLQKLAALLAKQGHKVHITPTWEQVRLHIE
jgi:hypothetical protein